MSYMEINRIVGMDAKYAQTLQCAICLSILDNPIITDCGHNFCYECLRYHIEDGNQECPQCRKQFTKRQTSWSSTDANAVVFFYGQAVYCFVRNLALKEVVSKLKVKCENSHYGCRETPELDQLPAHELVCEHMVCDECGQWSYPFDQHDCIDALKAEVDRLREQISQLKSDSESIEHRLSRNHIK